ncbi:MAG: right-handed parallel beta-helix repeat-containing protein [Planctomycetota bacterium]
MHDRSRWDRGLVGSVITPFQLKGEAYIFVLADSDETVHIVRMEDYGRCWDEKGQKYNYGAGWKYLYGEVGGSNYGVVTSFELDGHPYLFRLSNDTNHAYSYRINDDPSTGWTSMYEGAWDSGYVAIASFELDGHPYLLALDTNEQVQITRINDDPCTGWTTIYEGSMSSDYVAVASFELDGHPYLFALHAADMAYIHRINDDPCTGWTTIYEDSMSSEHLNVTSFELDGHPYLFGVHINNNAYIHRINDDPCTGWTNVYGDPCDEYLTAWYQFENNTLNSSGNEYHGSPHGTPGPLYSTDSRGEAYSIELNGEDDYVDVGNVNISGNSPRTIAGWVRATKSAGDMYGWRGIFGFTGPSADNRHFDIQRHGGRDYYCIHVYGWEGDIVKLDQEWHHLAATYDGKTIAWYSDGSRVGSEARVLNTYNDVHIGKRADNDSSFFPGLVDDVRIYSRALSQGEIAQLARSSIAVFEMNGHPYLFLQGNCCYQYDDITGCRWRPGEAYLKRINDDPCTGWEDLLQLEDIRIIRDRTVLDEDGPPAIMMGDFNIHRDKYGIMDELFGKAGAVDAYIEVHGSDAGGETGDLRYNKLAERLCPPGDPNNCDPDNHPLDRVDYVYVRQSGAGLRLVPTEAHVFRDWKYDSPSEGTIDLSDHFPLFAKFKIFEGGCTARAKGDLNCDRLINFADLAILCSAWMSRPGDGMWDPACDISDQPDDFIDTRDVDVIARSWLTMPVHNVTDNTWYGFIQTAIDDANDGDEIEVGPGTYYEAINFQGKAIRLYSRGGPEVTTIDPKGIGGAYHVVKCVSGEDANTILEGFTITGGNANGPTEADTHGGGMYCKNSSPTVTSCNFSGNAADSGGGMYNNNSSPTIINCNFSGNTTVGNGGGMFNNNSSPTVTNCTFSGNSAGGSGGAMRNYESNPTVTNCTFSGNSASAINGGGMLNTHGSPIVTNCILWGDSPDEIYNEGSTPNVTYSDVEGGTGQSWFGTECIDTNPNFVNAAGGDFRLLSSASPCVDAGDNNSVPGDTTDLDGDGNTTEPIPWDLAGSPRITDGDGDANAVVDMGAFELNGPVWNTTQNRLYSIIQAAIDDANDGDDIEVAEGTYKETINFLGKAVRLRSSDPNDPNIVAATIIDGTGNYHVVQCISGEGPDTILAGFTITGGNAHGGWPDNYGGGMYNQGSSPTVTNCIFTGNSASSGGGMYNNNNSSPTVTNCIFNGNSANSGGGMYNYQNSNPTVANCTFASNKTLSASYGGGGMYNDQSSPTVTNCNFTGNTAGSDGGGMDNRVSSNPTVTNCTFSNNSAIGKGGGMENNTSSPTVTNCIFTGNSATSDGGGMDNRISSNPTVINCTFSNNSAGWGSGMYNYQSSPRVTNSTFSGNQATNGGGGGMINNSSSSPAVTGCTFTDNSATSAGGGMLNGDGSDPNVTNCNFTGNTADTDGGGMYNDNSSPTLTDCNFTGNTADTDGGGIYNNWCSPTVRDCTFAGNTAIEGGGIYNGSVSSPTLGNCIFSGNEATSDGGGIYVYGGQPRLTGCIFNGNSADKGGGIYRWNPAYLTDCTFQDNTASYGGGMYNYQNYTCLLTDCNFSGNGASVDGGGMYNDSSSPYVTDCNFSNNWANWGGAMYNNVGSNPTVTNCSFISNEARMGGAGGVLSWSSPMITNCIFIGNSGAGDYGGGMSNWEYSTPVITNCTFSRNSAGSGGGMYNHTNSSPIVTNCILWSNTAPTGPQIHGGSPIVTYSDVQGGWGGAGNIDADPCFVDANNPDPNVWNLRLSYDSNCIDAGDTGELPPDTADLDGDGDTAEPIPFDLDGNNRVWNGTVDMGAYEYLIPPPPMSSAGNLKYLAMICANWLTGTKGEL